jgi:hypothetical protein
MTRFFDAHAMLIALCALAAHTATFAFAIA